MRSPTRVVANGTKGVASITNVATGAFTYTPNANANGTDSFTFKAHDAAVDSNTATVTVTITAVNDAPVASDQSVTTNEDTAKAITLSATDVEGSTLTYTIGAGPTHGTLSGVAPTVTYTPAANYNGPDSFTFKGQRRHARLERRDRVDHRHGGERRTGGERPVGDDQRGHRQGDHVERDRRGRLRPHHGRR